MVFWEQLSTKQQDQITLAFRQCDTDNDKMIDIVELKTILQALGEDGNEAQVKEVMKEIDSNSDGQLQFDEFKEAMASWMLQ